MEYYKRGWFKYVPERFIPIIRPKIIDTINKEGNIIGRVAGINLKPIDLKEEKLLNEYIQAIIKLNQEQNKTLIIEDYNHIDKESVDEIRKKTNMRIFTGENTKIKSIPIAIKEIYNLLKEDLKKQEILVISDRKAIAKDIIKSFSKEVRFITTIGDTEENIEEIYNSILEETGLSLFHSSNIEKILSNYSIIVNLKDTLDFNISKLRKSAIVFDLSHSKIFKTADKGRNTYHVIEDFIFQLDSLGIEDTIWINNKLSSNIYESLNEKQDLKFYQIYSNGDYYYLRDFVNLVIRAKGKM